VSATPLPPSPFLGIAETRDFAYDDAFAEAFLAAIAEPAPAFLRAPSADYLRAIGHEPPVETFGLQRSPLTCGRVRP
jgi:hypothetical protein